MCFVVVAVDSVAIDVVVVVCIVVVVVVGVVGVVGSGVVVVGGAVGIGGGVVVVVVGVYVVGVVVVVVVGHVCNGTSDISYWYNIKVVYTRLLFFVQTHTNRLLLYSTCNLFGGSGIGYRIF